MCVRKFIFAAALAVVGVLAAPPTAEAAFLLQLTSGSESVTIDLEDVPTSNPANGYTYSSFNLFTIDGETTAAFTNLRFAGYTMSTESNLTNLPGNNVDGGRLSLGFAELTRTGTAADDLTIALTATGFTQPTQQDELFSNFSARPVPRAGTLPTVEFASGIAFGVNEFGRDVENTATATASSFGGIPRSGFEESAVQTLGTDASSYSLTNVITITGMGNGAANRLATGGVSTQITPGAPQVVPAPAGLVLVLGAVPFLGLLRRRRTAADPTSDATTAA